MLNSLRKTRFSELAGGLAGFPTPWRAYRQAGRQAKSIKFLKENLVFGAWLAPWLAGRLVADSLACCLAGGLAEDKP